jgi:hypothetical protein
MLAPDGDFFYRCWCFRNGCQYLETFRFFPPLLVLEMAVSTQKHSAFISAISTPATRPLRM